MGRGHRATWIFFEAHKVELAFVDGKHHFIMCIGWGHPFVWHRMQGISSCADTPPSKQCSKVLARGSFWLSPVFLPSTTLVGIRLPPTLSSLAKDIPAAMAGRSARTFGSQLSHYADGTIHPVARERGMTSFAVLHCGTRCRPSQSSRVRILMRVEVAGIPTRVSRRKPTVNGAYAYQWDKHDSTDESRATPFDREAHAP